MKAIVTGSSGLLGSAIKKSLGEKGNFYHTRGIAELTSSYETDNMFDAVMNSEDEYDTLIHCAAKVGGLTANLENPKLFFKDNVVIDHNVLINAYKYQLNNVVTISSTCAFPAEANYPLTIEQLDFGVPHYSNHGYAYAKRLLCYQTKMYREVSEKNWISIIPTNLFGPNDNFNVEETHIIPGLIYKAYMAKKTGEDFIILGDGSPLRQFIFSEDLAKIILWAIENWKSGTPLIAVDETEYSVKYIAELIAKKFEIPMDKIVFDISKPNGQHRKPAKSSIPNFKFTPFEEAIGTTIDWFVLNFNNARK